MSAILSTSTGSPQSPASTGISGASIPHLTQEREKPSRPVEPTKKSAKQSESKADKTAAMIESYISKLSGQNTRLRINVDEASGAYVYQGINPDTGEVVSQYPAEDVLRQLSLHRQDTGGLVVDETA